MQAVLVCEASQKRSTVFAASRFACTALYGLLGAAAPAAANFSALAIKHIQHDTITGAGREEGGGEGRGGDAAIRHHHKSLRIQMQLDDGA